MKPSFIDEKDFAAYHSRLSHPAHSSTLRACGGSRPTLAVPMDLAMNAIDATSDTNGIQVITLFSRYDDADQLLVSVNDKGVGLLPQANQIFDAFSTTKPHGTGMGIAISRSIESQ